MKKPMRLGAALFACSSALAGCASPSTPTPVVPIAAAPVRSDKGTALVASLTIDVTEPRPIAEAIFATGDEAAIRAGSERLVAIARAVDTPAWRESQRASVVHTFDGGGVTPPPEMIASDIEDRVMLRLRSLFDAMTILRSEAAKRYAFEIAGRAASNKWSRHAALDALAVLVEAKNASDVALRAELRAEVAELDPKPAPAGKSPADVIADLRKPIRHCYSDELAVNPGVANPKVLATVNIDATGAPEPVTFGGDAISPSFRACLEAALQRARFSPPAGGSMRILVPLQFTEQR